MLDSSALKQGKVSTDDYLHPLDGESIEKIIVGKLDKRQIDQLTLSINPSLFSWNFKNLYMGLGGSGVKNLPTNTKDTGSTPDPRRSPCHGATKPGHHNYWTCALEPRNHSCWSLHTLEPSSQEGNAPQWEAHTPQLESGLHSLKAEKSPLSNEDPAEPKISKNNFF